MTEHAAGIFVFFFLAEYASIILMCILISIVLLGGYDIFSLISIFVNFIYNSILLIFSIYMSIVLLFINYLNINMLYINIDLIHNFNDSYIYENILNDVAYLTNNKYVLSFNILTYSIIYIFVLGLKTCILIFTFI